MGVDEVIKVHSAAFSLITSAPEHKAALQIASDILGNPVPLDPGELSNILRLSRDQAARFLRRLGYPISANRLAKLAVHGGGPLYRKWGRSVVYDPFTLLEWAQGRESSPQLNTSVSNLSAI